MAETQQIKYRYDLLMISLVYVLLSVYIASFVFTSAKVQGFPELYNKQSNKNTWTKLFYAKIFFHIIIISYFCI